jgi:hypothetical protein
MQIPVTAQLRDTDKKKCTHSVQRQFFFQIFSTRGWLNPLMWKPGIQRAEGTASSTTEGPDLFQSRAEEVVVELWGQSGLGSHPASITL